MNKVLTKSYNVYQKPINVLFSPKVVSIDCTNHSNPQDLAKIYNGSKQLIPLIKAHYEDFFGQKINISNRSFMAEIWGHLIAYRIALWTISNINISFIQKLAKFAAFRSGVIDCGEAKVDTNRWFWDLIGWLFFRK